MELVKKTVRVTEVNYAVLTMENGKVEQLNEVMSLDGHQSAERSQSKIQKLYPKATIMVLGVEHKKETLALPLDKFMELAEPIENFEDVEDEEDEQE